MYIALLTGTFSYSGWFDLLDVEGGGGGVKFAVGLPEPSQKENCFLLLSLEINFDQILISDRKMGEIKKYREIESEREKTESEENRNS